MALTERLALLVTLDAKGAVKGLNDIGRAADKGLGQAETKIDRTAQKFKRAGAGMLAASGLAAVGLYKAGQAAADLEQAVGGTEAVFKSASGAIDKFAKNADQKMGLSERAFREATTRIGGQLKGVGFSMDEAADRAIELTGVAADLAATYGGTTAEAVDALSAAFRGEADPAERFNLRLNQNTVNAKAMALGLAESTSSVSAQAKAQATLALIMEQSADAQGQFAREADTAAGAQARMSAALENLKANIGSAVAPIIADVADAIGGLSDGFNKLPTSAQNSISKVAAFGTIALAAAGGLSFIIGKTLDFRTRLDELAVSAPRTASAINRLGRVGLAIGGIIAVGEALDAAFNKDHTGDITEIENALARLGQGAAVDGLKINMGELRDALDRVLDPNIGQSIDNMGESLLRSIPLIGHALGSAAHGLQDAQEAIDGLDKGLAQLAARDPDLAASALAQVAASLGRPVSDLMPLLDDYERALTGIDTESRTAAAGTDEFGSAAGGAVGPVDALTSSLEDQQDAYQGLLDARTSQFSSDLSYRNAVDAVSEAQDKLNNFYKDGKTDVRAYRDAQRSLRDALLSQEDAADSVLDAQAELNRLEFEGKKGTNEYEDAVRALRRAENAAEDAVTNVSDTREDIANLHSEGATSAGDYADALRDLESAMLAQAEAAVKAEQDRHFALTGQDLSPADQARVHREELLKLAATLSPGSELRTRLEGYADDLGLIPKTIETTLGIKVVKLNELIPQAIEGLIASGDVLGLGSPTTPPQPPPPNNAKNDITNPMALGGLVPQYRDWGGVMFPGGPRGTDTVPAWLTPGEFIVRKKAVDKYGLGLLRKINAGYFEGGGPIQQLYEQIGALEGVPARFIEAGGGGTVTAESRRLRDELDRLLGREKPPRSEASAGEWFSGPMPRTSANDDRIFDQNRMIAAVRAGIAEAAAVARGDVFHVYGPVSEDSLQVAMRESAWKHTVIKTAVAR